MRYIHEADLSQYQGKICLLRVDLNIERNEAEDNFRIQTILPTITFLVEHGMKVVLLSHRGRFGEEKSLEFFVPILSKKLNQPVTFLTHFNFPEIYKQIHSEESDVFLLENLRFREGEEANSPRFAERLAGLGDLYVNDAFSVSHRVHASVVAITKLIPSYAGLRFEAEIKNLSRVMKEYKRPFTLILGGVKVKDKLGIIKYFWKKADTFLLGGGPANTFLAAQDVSVGDSLIDKSALPLIEEFVGREKIVVPVDFKTKDDKHLDIGPRTVKKYREIIENSHTIIWNGPMGMFEEKEFSEGTKGIWEAVLKNEKSQVVVGGGETLASLRLLKPNTSQPLPAGRQVTPNIFLSTGGGAMLKFLTGEQLPGIKALKME